MLKGRAKQRLLLITESDSTLNKRACANGYRSIDSFCCVMLPYWVYALFYKRSDYARIETYLKWCSVRFAVLERVGAFEQWTRVLEPFEDVRYYVSASEIQAKRDLRFFERAKAEWENL